MVNRTEIPQYDIFDDGEGDFKITLHKVNVMVTISQEVAKILNYEALGVWMKILTMPEGTPGGYVSMMEYIGIGRDKLRRLIQDLKKVNVLKIVPVRQSTGKWKGQQWYISPVPIGVNRTTEIQSPGTGLLKNRTTENQYRNKEYKNIKNISNKILDKVESNYSCSDFSKKSPARGSRIPADFEPSERMLDWAMALGYTQEFISMELQKFKNYWEAKPGKDAVKLDWHKTWQNWMLTASQNLNKALAVRTPMTKRERTQQAALEAKKKINGSGTS